MRRGGGFSLVELAVALALGGIIAAVLAGALVSGERLVRSQGERVEGEEARRIALTVLTAELRYVEPRVDLLAVGRDSIALRAFRGTAIACAAAGSAVLVRYRGLREPEPAKDSVVAAGLERDPPARPLTASQTAASGCAHDARESLYRWTLPAPPPPPGTLLLLFESGSYHLSTGAFRYRRGSAGRQPLTGEVFDDRAGGFRLLGATGATVDRAVEAHALDVVLVRRLPGALARGRAAAFRARVGFPNQAGESSGAGGPGAQGPP